MNLEPQKFFIGLMDFFTILLPGALLTYLLMGEVGPFVLGSDKYQNLTGVEGWAAFLVTSYLFGHLLFLTGSWLDEFPYDWLRQRHTLNRQFFRLAHKGKLLPKGVRVLIWTVFKQERDLAVDRASKIKEQMLKGLHAKNALNTFQWSKALLAKEHPESLATVQRFEADSKFFRSFVIVLLVLSTVWFSQLRFLLSGLSFLLILPALWKFMEQRHKATNQAYWSVITLTARSGKVALYGAAPSDSGLKHAGGVVYRMCGGRAEYLLVEAKDDPEQWELPIGHIEEDEHQRETAVREVHQETRVWAKICADLGPVPYSLNGTVIMSHFFLMKFLGSDLRSKVNREIIWLPLEGAVGKVKAREKAKAHDIEGLLQIAEQRRVRDMSGVVSVHAIP